jgi:hypothetical protein
MNYFHMKMRFICFSGFLAAFLSVGCQHSQTTAVETSSVAPAVNGVSEKESPAEVSSRYVFGWGNLPAELANPRGGTTRGTQVTLAPARELPLTTIADATDNFSRDRAAILSLVGEYKASFHFLETMGLYSEHTPARPYHSWSTEQIRVLDDRDTFISLQHSLVIFIEEEDGTVVGPYVMKHWRQDWSYEDTDLHTYRGDGSWARDIRSPESVEGTWTQAVWQVDDSPRYEAVGRWTHEGNRSIWTGENSWRPLPRREYSVRDDYGVMEGFHRIVITPTGWLHEQNNWKRVAGEKMEQASYRGHELGLDRYELIVSPGLAAADDYWEKTGPYWADVREVWQEIFVSRDRFTLRKKVDDRSQFEFHFEYAGKLDEGAAYNPVEGKRFGRETIEKFLANDGVEGDQY